MPRLTVRLLNKFFKNFPKSYIDKEKGIVPKKIYGNRFGAPDIVTYDVHPDDYVPGEEEPWTKEAKLAKKKSSRKVTRLNPNLRNWSYKPPKLNSSEETFFVGDRVEVLVGKDRGKQGIISEVNFERNWCYVTGLNCESKFINPKGFAGQLVQESKKLKIGTEVALVDPADERVTEVEWKWTEDGDRIRVSCRSGRHIPMPVACQETYEYKSAMSYREEPYDTPVDLVEKVTYVPKAQLFEDSIKEEYGIDDGGKTLKQTFWY